MEKRSYSAGDALPSHSKDFETVRSGVFATPDIPQARNIAYLQLRDSVQCAGTQEPTASNNSSVMSLREEQTRDAFEKSWLRV